MPKSRPSRSGCRHWTEAHARSVLDELDASGESVVAFAQRHGLVAQRLYWWRRRLHGGIERTEPETTFVEILPKPAAPVEIVLRSDRVLRVAESIDGETLLRLVELLERECAC
jgi:transposase-like protein